MEPYHADTILIMINQYIVRLGNFVLVLFFQLKKLAFICFKVVQRTNHVALISPLKFILVE